jgi:hypothetical protein
MQKEQHFGVIEQAIVGHHPIVIARQHVAVLVNEYGADGRVALSCGLQGFFNGKGEKRFILGSCVALLWARLGPRQRRGLG